MCQTGRRDETPRFSRRFAAGRKKLIALVRQWVADTGDKFNLPED
jgi:hypothetical protein